jgi:hypothetical protein
MRIHVIATICAALAGVSLLPASALAQKTEKACQDEWRANRAANQAAGITEKAYVVKCRAGTEAPSPAAASPAPAPSKSPPPAKATPTAKAAPAPAAGTVGKAETQAKPSCPGDIVVWANLDSKIYHFSGTRSYGTTKDGAYMCEKAALAQGIRAAKNEKHP